MFWKSKEKEKEKESEGGPITGLHEVPTHSSAQQQQQLPPARFESNFATVSLHMSDRIRLMNFPLDIANVVRAAIIASWPRGIQYESEYYGSYEFQLSGRPWSESSWDSVHAERMTRHILEKLYNAGWILALSTDVSRKLRDKDTLIFRQQHPTPTPCYWTTVSFSWSDRIRILDASPELVHAIVMALGPAIQKMPWEEGPGAWEMKLHGYPWRASGGATMDARRLLLLLLSVLEQFGFSVYASIDQKMGAGENSSESDLWHCCRPVNWVAGAPVYHR